MPHLPSAKLDQEFNRQLENLIQKGYPKLAGVKKEKFIAEIESLRKRLERLNLPAIDLERGRLSFVIVVKSDWVDTEKAMALVKREGKTGFTNLFPRKPNDFEPIDHVKIPDGMAYLLAGVDRGKETINLTPSEALKIIKRQKRSPLTIDEGVAIVTHYPEFLMKNNCFSLFASCYAGDKRVPAIWITAEKTVRLGWCWDGNPHTWLGSASCAKRIGL